MKGKLMYVNKSLFEEITRRKNITGKRNTDVMKEIAVDSKIGDVIRGQMEFWGIVKRKK